jgi:hypothetical protein
MDMHPKYIWYYAAAILLVYFIWNYYSIHPNNHLGTTSLGLYDNDMSSQEIMQHEASDKLPFSSLFDSLENAYEQGAELLGGSSSRNSSSSSSGKNKAATSLHESTHTLSDQLNVPNYQSNSFESQIVGSVGGNNLMTTPNYSLSKSHILLERQVPPT